MDTKINLSLPAELEKLRLLNHITSQCQASYCIHLMSLKGECFLLTQEFEKAAHVLSQVCTLFNRWKAGKKSFEMVSEGGGGAITLDVVPAAVIDD